MANKDQIIKSLNEKPVNQSLKSKQNRHFQDRRHSLLNVQGVGNARIKTEAGDVQFEDNLAVLPNDGQADEIEAELRANATHPHQVKRVADRERYNGSDTHRYFFGQFNGVPWAKYDERGRRIRDG